MSEPHIDHDNCPCTGKICLSVCVRATISCWCVHSSISNVAPHWVCSSLYAQIKAAVFQVSKLCNILSRIQTLQQSFRYISKPCSIVFHVSKLCSSLSCIQSLQQSFTYPKLAAVFHISKPCQQQPKITDFKLCNTQGTLTMIVR